MNEIEVLSIEQLVKITEIDDKIRPEVESQIIEDERLSHENPVKYQLNKDINRYKAGSVGLHIQFRDIIDPIIIEFEGGLRQSFHIKDLDIAPIDAPLSHYKEYSKTGKRGMKPETIEKVTKIQKMLDEGYTRKEVREICGVSSSLFSQYVRYGQIDYNPSEEEKAEIKRDWSERAKRHHTEKRDARIGRIYEGMEKFDTIRQVCMYADTHPPTFHRWAADGHIDSDKYNEFMERVRSNKYKRKDEFSRQLQKGASVKESLLQKDPTLVDKIYLLAEQGYSRSEIVNELKIGYSTLQKWLDKGLLDKNRIPSQRGRKPTNNNGTKPVKETPVKEETVKETPVKEVVADVVEEAKEEVKEEHIVKSVETDQNDRLDRLIAVMEEVSKNQTKLLECVSSLLQQSNNGDS